MANEPLITVVGNLVADPEPRISQAGKSWVTFRVANTPRVRDSQSGDWSDGEALWLSCRAYGSIADNITASLKKGMRVLMLGKLTQRNYTDNQGNKRTSMEFETEAIGPDLTFATVSVTSSRGGSSGPAGSGYAAPPAAPQRTYGSTPNSGYAAPPTQQQGYAAPPAGAPGFDDEAPF